MAGEFYFVFENIGIFINIYVAGKVKMESSCIIQTEETSTHSKTSRGKNDWRADLISQARVSPHLLKSLQPCTILENGKVLQELKASLKSVAEINKINGLLAVLEHLLLTKIMEDGKEVPNSHLKFEAALELFLGFDTSYVPGSKDSYDVKRFQYALLHPKCGLCVYIFNPLSRDGYIILRSDDVDFSTFLVHLSTDLSSKSINESRFQLNKETVQMLLKSMDSEWDKKVVRIILGAVYSLKELSKLGMDATKVAANTSQVLEMAKECKNAHIAAEDIITQNIEEQIKSAKTEADKKEALVLQKRAHWPVEKITELEEEIKKVQDHAKDMENLLTPTTKQHQQQFKRRCKRKAEYLIQIH